MKIAFIGARGVIGKYSGIETYYEETGSRLVELGHEVTVYCRSYFTPDIEHYRGMRIKRLPTVRSKHLETIFHSLLSTFDALFRHYDIVSFHALGSAPLALIPRFTGTKTVVLVHGLDGRRAKWGWLAQQYLKACEWLSILTPSATAVVSRQLADYYAQNFAANVTYIPNGVAKKLSITSDYIAPFGLEPNAYILYVGRLTPEKGCHYLLDAFKKLDTDLKLVFVGGGAYADDYLTELKKDESARILFVGFQDGEVLESLFSHAYLYVLPSTIEGLSISLLEAMSYGRCVLTSDIPENLEISEEHGFTFHSEDADHLKYMLDYLVQNPDLVERKGKDAKAYIQVNYTWDMVAHRNERLFKSLLTRVKTTTTG